MKGPLQAVRIGGKKAPRRMIQKKEVKVDNSAKLGQALTGLGYRTQAVSEVENCSFMGQEGTVINYSSPDVSAVFHKDDKPVGYIIRGRGEVLNKGGQPSYDLETITQVLSQKGINIKDLVKRVEEDGDRKALDEIVELIKGVKFSGPEEEGEEVVEEEVVEEEVVEEEPTKDEE
ncbi:hypothetical protein NEHOM01_1245 [Nematocida homosporus]|uniref:uncharacterized protein n=1 Tax=Nematocida homosporus TaxID=1912981 RepID=UPI00221F130C|nr:uncharacterized protein NEHOM01_1245 [Nematocida homosporus]KAI5186042.1 hypothetical protein NEHOM01_1245 [Nematocida homosporus]